MTDTPAPAPATATAPATAPDRPRRLPSPAFWRGLGHLYDSSHGGLVTHCATPDHVVAELEKLSFRLIKFMGDDHPRTSRALLTDWYYYVFSKTDNCSIGRKSCA